MHVGLVDLRWEGHHTPYIVYLSRYFSDNGYEITFITDKDHQRLDDLPDTENLIVRTESFPKCNLHSNSGLIGSVNEQRIRIQQLHQIFEAADESDVDIVHLLYFDRTQVPLWVTSKLQRKPLPLITATLHRDAFTDRKNAAGIKRATQWVTRRALNLCFAEGTLNCLTVHAESIRQRIVNTVAEATEKNTQVLPAPTPKLSVSVSQAEARKRLGLPRDEPLFLFFGGLRYEKGPDLLAKALQITERRLTVVYAGPEADFTQANVDEWKRQTTPNANIVDRIGFVPESKVDSYFLAADALILPYRRTRGISGPLRRSAMAGTPIVAPDNSDIGSIVNQHDLGVCVDGPIEIGLAEWFNDYTQEMTLASAEALSSFAESRHWTATGDGLLEIFDGIT